MMRLRSLVLPGQVDTPPPEVSLRGLAAPATTAADGPPTTLPRRRQRDTVAIIRIARFWPNNPGAAAASGAPAALERLESDGLDAFGSEAPPRAISEPVAPARPDPVVTPAPPTGRRTTRGSRGLAVGIAVVMTAIASGAGVRLYQARTTATAMGSLTLETNPAGVAASVAGQPAGVTPLTLSLGPGEYDVRLTDSHGQVRDLRVQLAAGSTVVRHVEFPVATPPAGASGGILVQSEPPRAAVTIDGVKRGRTPVSIDALSPGEHLVVVSTDRGSVSRTVTVEAGKTLSLLVSPMEAPGVVSGWLSVSAPVAMQLREGGRLIGTTETDRLLLPAGQHEIEIVNEAIGYRSVRQVNIGGGRTAQVSIELPQGTLSLNALPWAEVYVDGERIGDTPIANLSRTIGPHEVVFRHPQFGERRATVMITADRPARLGIDMRRH
jgi:hypothetical protein